MLNSSDDFATLDRQWQQGQLVEVTITDLSDSGEGVGRYGQRVVFVPDTVTGDRALVRLLRVKPQYAHGQLSTLLQASPYRRRSPCIVADKCGGCQWQHVDYGYQQTAKFQVVLQALTRIGQFEQPPLLPLLSLAAPSHPASFEAVEPASPELRYRNKVSYPLGLSRDGQVQAGYYRKGSHRLVNLNQCPVQDVRLDPLLAEIKRDIQSRGWSIYQERTQQGHLRHLSLRVGRRTGEMLLTLVSTTWELEGMEAQAAVWCDRFPGLVGVCLNRNTQANNVIFGPETRCLAGKPYLEEIFAGLRLQIGPETFFQVYTEQAEALLTVIEQWLALQGTEFIVDAYCGIGTLALPLARRSRQVLGLEIQREAVEQAQQNAQLNGLDNVSFLVGSVETLLPQLTEHPSVVLLDPPRKGCDRAVLDSLLQIRPDRIVYMSCKPATLARDLRLLCEGGAYQLVQVQPADFFPQTSHVEAVALLMATQ